MSYTPADTTQDATWVGAASYTSPVTILVGNWDASADPTIYPVGIYESAFGSPEVIPEQFITVSGWDSSVLAAGVLVTDDTQYIPPYVELDVTWQGQETYAAPDTNLIGSWQIADFISAIGIAPAVEFGTPLVYVDQEVTVTGFESSNVSTATLVTRDGEYIPPFVVLNVDWIGKEGYYPPRFDQVSGRFGILQNNIQAFGIASTAAFGTPLVFTTTIEAAGWQSSLFSEGLTFENAADSITAGGINPGIVPTDHYIGFRTRPLFPSGITSTIDFGDAYVADFYQFINLLDESFVSSTFGTTTIADAIRYVYPSSIVAQYIGNHGVFINQDIEPVGWENLSLVGAHQLDINLQRLFPEGIAPIGFGTIAVRNAVLLLGGIGFVNEQFGLTDVANLDQVIEVGPFNDNGNPDTWPNFSPHVANRNRTLPIFGFSGFATPILGPTVENAGEGTWPSGFESLEFGTADVGYFERTISVAGSEYTYFGGFTHTYNDAFQILPEGLQNTQQFGATGPVLNADRTFTGIGGIVSTFAAGIPFVAYAIRTVAPPGLEPTKYGDPDIRWNPYPLAPTGFDSALVAQTIVYEHFNIIEARVGIVNQREWGNTDVANRNKTLTFPGSKFTEFGFQRIENFIKEVAVAGSDFTQFGAHVIRDRTITVRPAALVKTPFPVTHYIYNVIPPGPATQLVISDGGILSLVFGTASVDDRTIYPAGFEDTYFGSTDIARNEIEIFPGIGSNLAFGEHSVGSTRWLYPSMMPLDPDFGLSDLNGTNPRITPHTIYAPSSEEATPQAKNNHPGPPPTVIDRYLTQQGYGQWSEGGGHPWFGRPDVSNFVRTIGPVPSHPENDDPLGPSSEFGVPDVELKDRVIYPPSVYRKLFGIVVILNTPQDVLPVGWENGATFGTTVIPSPVSPPFADPVGFDALTIPNTHRVELFIRTVPPDPLVNEPTFGTGIMGWDRTYQTFGADTANYGTTRVEHRIRNVETESWEEFEARPDIDNFHLRMRVIRLEPQTVIEQAAVGATMVIGTPEISFADREIRGRGIKPIGVGTPRFDLRIYPSGWDSLVVGDIDEWEENKLKPYGPDFAVVPSPVIGSGLSTTGFDSSAVGVPRMGTPIYVSGLPPIGFDGPTVTDECGCNVRVVAAAPILSGNIFPQPTVT